MMVNPIEVQTFVVRAVDAAQNVNQIQNAVLAAQQTGLFENVKRSEVERSRINPQERAEQKEVKNSLEGSNRGAYIPYRRRANLREERERKNFREDKKGLILDVRL